MENTSSAQDLAPNEWRIPSLLKTWLLMNGEYHLCSRLGSLWMENTTSAQDFAPYSWWIPPLVLCTWVLAEEELEEEERTAEEDQHGGVHQQEHQAPVLRQTKPNHSPLQLGEFPPFKGDSLVQMSWARFFEAKIKTSHYLNGMFLNGMLVGWKCDVASHYANGMLVGSK